MQPLTTLIITKNNKANSIRIILNQLNDFRLIGYVISRSSFQQINCVPYLFVVLLYVYTICNEQLYNLKYFAILRAPTQDHQCVITIPVGLIDINTISVKEFCKLNNPVARELEQSHENGIVPYLSLWSIAMPLAMSSCPT